MNPLSLPPGCAEHLAGLEQFFSMGRVRLPLATHYRKMLARRYNFLIRPNATVLEVGCGEGELLSYIDARRKVGIDLSGEQIARGKQRFPDLDLRVGCPETGNLPREEFDVIILSDVLNYSPDVEVFLRRLTDCCHRNTRILINIHNTLWRPLIDLARALGFSNKQPMLNWLSRQDVTNLCFLADWNVFKWFGIIICPIPLGLISNFLNRFVGPLLPPFCFSIFLVACRTGLPRRDPDTVSVVIPARNEAGSVTQAIERMPQLAPNMEVIFIEGHSKDNTWEVIQNLPDTFRFGSIIKLQQTGKGKGNAVIEGFKAATGQILMILDADLTVPPEDLPKFVEVLTAGKADFANGVRLVYPMDKNAMKFANLCANKGFSILFSWLLGQPVKDTLCGTKVLWQEDYQQIDRGREYFGNFDPFGDFDLLFGADKQNLRIIDVPIRYKERFYGETNIQRWKHGVILLRMVVFAAQRLKFI